MQVYHDQSWKEPLCGCLHDRGVCCYGLCCCCCLYGDIAEKVDPRSKCITHCGLYSLLSVFGCCCLLHAITRGQFRERYSLEESVFGDCAITCCCSQCAICQEAREMKVRGYPPPPLIIIHQPATSLSSNDGLDGCSE